MHVQDHDVAEAASRTRNTGVKETRPPRAAICWQSLRGSPCKNGPDCRFYHLSNEEVKLLESALEMHGPASSSPPPPPPLQGKKPQLEAQSKVAQSQTSQLRLGLRKTKLCYRYPEGKCPRGAMCHYVHMHGPEAQKFLNIANSVRLCPHELVYSSCSDHSCCIFFHKLPQGERSSPESSMTGNELSSSDSSISASANANASIVQTGRIEKEETRKEGQEGSTLLHCIRDEDCSESSGSTSTKCSF